MGELTRNDLEKLGQGFLSLHDLDKSYPQLISTAALPSSSKTGYGHSQRLIPGYSHCQLQFHLTMVCSRGSLGDICRQKRSKLKAEADVLYMLDCKEHELRGVRSKDDAT